MNKLGSSDIANECIDILSMSIGSKCSSYTNMTATSPSCLLKCPLCDKVFTNSSAIAKHKLTHSEQRKYVCDVCGKAFKRQDHLNGHKLTHQNRKPHACRLCEKSFSDSRSLRRHYENQHGEELHQLQRRKHLASGDTHLSHSSVSLPSTPEGGRYEDLEEILDPLFVAKNVFCTVCSKGFKNLAALNGHMRLHGGYTTLSQRRHHMSPIPQPLSSPAASTSTVQTATYLSPSPALSCSYIVPVSAQSTEQSIHIQSSSTTTPTATVSPTSQTTSLSTEIVPLMHPSSNRSYCDSFTPTLSAPCMELSNTLEVTRPLDLLEGIEFQNLDLNNFIDSIEENLDSPGPPLLSKIETCESTGNDTQPLDEDLLKDFFPGAESGHVGHLMGLERNDTRRYQEICNIDMTTTTIDNNKKAQIWKNRACHFTFEPAHVNLSNRLSGNQVYAQHGSPVPNVFSMVHASTYQESSAIVAPYYSDFCDTPTVTTPSCPSLGPWDDPPPPSLTREEGVMDTEVTSSSIDTSLSEGFSSYIFRNPLCRPPFKKSKCKPAPIHIPPQCNAYVSRLRSPRYVGPFSAGPHGGGSMRYNNPPPYTPFPMLSPHRKGTGLYCSMRKAHRSTPVTPRLLSLDVCSPHAGYNACLPTQCYSYRGQPAYWNSSNGATPSSISQTSANYFNYDEQALDECRSSLGAASTVSPGGVFSFSVEENSEIGGEFEDGIISSVHPAINVGPSHQAALPSFHGDMVNTRNDRREYEDLLWDPKVMITDMEKLKSLDLLMKIACSPAIRDCGFNLECTFNLVCKHKGDLDAALRDLLRQSFAACDHIYAESSSWTSEEILCFQESIRRHNRNFTQLSRDLHAIGSQKSVKSCVEFYYMWKRMNKHRDNQEGCFSYPPMSITIKEESHVNIEKTSQETRQRSASSNVILPTPHVSSTHSTFEFS